MSEEDKTEVRDSAWEQQGGTQMPTGVSTSATSKPGLVSLAEPILPARAEDAPQTGSGPARPEPSPEERLDAAKARRRGYEDDVERTFKVVASLRKQLAEAEAKLSQLRAMEQDAAREHDEARRTYGA